MKWAEDKGFGSLYSDDGKWDILRSEDGTFMLRQNVGDGSEADWQSIRQTFYDIESAQAYPEGHPLEIVGHDGLEGTERVIIDSDRLTRSGEDVHFLARYLTSGNDAGAGSYSAAVGGWTFVRDTVTGKKLAQYTDGWLADKEMVDYSEGRAAGEAWARATGTTEADLHFVPSVKGSQAYRMGHRLGVAKIRRERHLAENNIPDHSDRPLFGC